ncbi:TPA: hypothetical protein ACH3X2_011876 [Trebouxia sp. C0005]
MNCTEGQRPLCTVGASIEVANFVRAAKLRYANSTRAGLEFQHWSAVRDGKGCDNLCLHCCGFPALQQWAAQEGDKPAIWPSELRYQM